jgi:hypothetical protein
VKDLALRVLCDSPVQGVADNCRRLCPALFVSWSQAFSGRAGNSQLVVPKRIRNDIPRR